MAGNDATAENSSSASTPAPILPPRPSASINNNPARKAPPSASSAGLTPKPLEPPPRRPGAPPPGSLSIARSMGSNYYNISSPAVASPGPMSIITRSTASSVTPFPSTSSLSVSPAYTTTMNSTSPSSTLLPPPVRRLPAFNYAAGSPSHSPVMTPTSLDAPSSPNPSAGASAEVLPKLPPRRHPSQPRPSHPPSGAIYASFDKKSFLPTSSPLPSAGLSASTATATLLPPPVRTHRPSPSGSHTTATRLAVPASGGGGLGSGPGSSRSGGSTPGGSPARPTAAIVAPAARTRYEALFDRELDAQSRSSRKRRASKPGAHLAPAIAENSLLSRSLGNGPDLSNPMISRLRAGGGGTSFNSTLNGKPTGTRHRFGTSDPSFSNICRGSGNGSGSEHSSSNSSTPSPANVNALKGFFEGKSAEPSSSSVSKFSPVKNLQNNNNNGSTLSLPTAVPRLPERKMTKSNTDSGLRIDLDALRLRPPPLLTVRSPGNGSSRARAVSASASGSASADEGGMVGGGGGGSLSPSSIGLEERSSRVLHERERCGGVLGGPLRSLSSKDLRADALNASSPFGGGGTSTSSTSSSGSSSKTILSTMMAAPRLSPRRTRRLWRKSRLREVFLAKLWDVMGGNEDGITRESFVTGMAAIDFELAKRAASRFGEGPGVGGGGSRGRPAERVW